MITVLLVTGLSSLGALATTLVTFIRERRHGAMEKVLAGATMTDAVKVTVVDSAGVSTEIKVEGAIAKEQVGKLVQELGGNSPQVE